MPKKKRKPRHQPAVHVAEAFRGLLHLVGGVLTDTQLNDRHHCAPESKSCPSLPGRICPQGMVLGYDPFDPSGEDPDLPSAPEFTYRCQDCDRVERIDACDCAIGKCSTTIRNALGPAEQTVRLLEGGELRLVMDCTTGHVTGAEAVGLNSGSCPLRMNNHEHGWFIFLPDELSGPEEMGWEEFPALRLVAERAMVMGCGFINFDQDGGVHKGLAVHEW